MNKEVNQVGVDERYTEDGAFFTAIGSAQYRKNVTHTPAEEIHYVS